MMTMGKVRNDLGQFCGGGSLIIFGLPIPYLGMHKAFA